MELQLVWSSWQGSSSSQQDLGRRPLQASSGAVCYAQRSRPMEASSRASRKLFSSILWRSWIYGIWSFFRRCGCIHHASRGAQPLSTWHRWRLRGTLLPREWRMGPEGLPRPSRCFATLLFVISAQSPPFRLRILWPLSRLAWPRHPRHRCQTFVSTRPMAWAFRSCRLGYSRRECYGAD